MLDVPPNTVEDRERWQSIIIMAGTDLRRRHEVQCTRSAAAADIDRWVDRVPRYYAGSSKALGGLIKALDMLRASLNADWVDSKVDKQKDPYFLPNADVNRRGEDADDPDRLGNIEDLEILARMSECARETNAFLDGMEGALKSFQAKLRARSAAEPAFIEWLHTQRQSIVELDAPDSQEDCDRVLDHCAEIMQRVDDAVKDFEIVKFNVMPSVRCLFTDSYAVLTKDLFFIARTNVAPC